MDAAKSSMKAVILLGPKGLKTHLISLLLGYFTITFLDGQKHLKSLLLLRNIVCVYMCVEDLPCEVSIGNHRVRPPVRVKEEDRDRG